MSNCLFAVAVSLSREPLSLALKASLVLKFVPTHSLTTQIDYFYAFIGFSESNLSGRIPRIFAVLHIL
jgi:hypothetical protein